MLRYTVSIVLLLAVSWTSLAQVDSTDARPPKPPKVKKELKEFIPTGIRLGVDIYSIGRGIWEEEKSLQEYQLEVDLRHYLFVFEYGTAKLERTGDDFSYNNDGSYFRVGPEINFLYDPVSFDVVSVGLRYASSSFDDRLVYGTADAFGTTQIAVSNEPAKATWAEMTVGTKIKLWKGLFMGFTIRYKFLKSIKFTDLQPNYIPGFGENRLDDNDQFGFSYYLAWRFGFRKKSVIPIED